MHVATWKTPARCKPLQPVRFSVSSGMAFQDKAIREGALVASHVIQLPPSPAPAPVAHAGPRTNARGRRLSWLGFDDGRFNRCAGYGNWQSSTTLDMGAPYGRGTHHVSQGRTGGTRPRSLPLHRGRSYTAQPGMQYSLGRSAPGVGGTRQGNATLSGDSYSSFVTGGRQEPRSGPCLRAPTAPWVALIDNNRKKAGSSASSKA